MPVILPGDVRDKLEGTFGLKVGADGICCSSSSC